MHIPDPDIYAGKRLAVYGDDGSVMYGYLYGFCYDYDDDDNPILDFDLLEDESGMVITYHEHEIERIEVVGK